MCGPTIDVGDIGPGGVAALLISRISAKFVAFQVSFGNFHCHEAVIIFVPVLNEAPLNVYH